MRNIKLTLEYDGSDFCGWQRQGPQRRTVQGEIEKALKQITGQNIRLIGSGRTDSGVHALGQVANFHTNSSLSVETLLKALNSKLPADIVVLKTREVSKNFHAQYSVKTKTYRYTILNRATRSPIHRNDCFFYPYPLDIARMRREAKALLGKRDFKSFQAADPAQPKKRKEKVTIRTIKKVNIQRKGSLIYIDIESNGFLYKMARNIVGTLLDIGSGRIPKGSMEKILAKKSRLAAAQTAKPQGLCLLQVKY